MDSVYPAINKVEVQKIVNEVISDTVKIPNASQGGSESESGISMTQSVTAVTTDVSEVVEEVMPAMVSIINTYTEKYSYFGQAMQREGSASGSGIIVGENEKELQNINFIPNIIIIDPPRSGLSKEAIKNILKIKPKKLIYVSCDPMTFVRDLNLLNEKYEIIEITPFDMFPNTKHVECLGFLVLK